MQELDTKRHTKPNGYKVSLRRSGDAWVIAWQSPRMTAPSFWYYDSEGMARDVFRYFARTSTR